MLDHLTSPAASRQWKIRAHLMSPTPYRTFRPQSLHYGFNADAIDTLAAPVAVKADMIYTPMTTIALINAKADS